MLYAHDKLQKNMSFGRYKSLKLHVTSHTDFFLPILNRRTTAEFYVILQSKMLDFTRRLALNLALFYG